MDPYAQAGMIFTVVMTLIIGGFIVTFPVLRRLGRVMEESIRERQQARLGRENSALLRGEIEQLQHAIGQMQGHLELCSGCGSERFSWTAALALELSGG